jgi:hypothetical protein
MLTAPGLNERMDWPRYPSLGLLADVDIISWRGFRLAARCGRRRRARRGQLPGQGTQQPDRNNIAKKKSRARSL